jgi:hypothetical protein
LLRLMEYVYFAPGWLRSDRDDASYAVAWVRTGTMFTGEGLVAARRKIGQSSTESSSSVGYAGDVTMSKSFCLGVRGVRWKFLGVLNQVNQFLNHSVQQGFPNAVR